MQKLNLETKGREQELIKAFLEENATPTLADKINNGVFIEKDGKRLINKKTLNGFMKFAASEARKLVEKSANSACVEDNVVFGWAIHYFEEESIEGTLYNEDGTPYKKPVTVTAKPNTKVVPVTSHMPPKPQKKQTSIFDMLTGDNEDENSDNSSILPHQSQNEAESDEIDEEDYDEDEILGENEGEEEIAPVISPIQSKMLGSPLYQKYMQLQSKYPDCILFMRLGDFYEVLGKKAVTAAEALELTLTGRDCGLSERVPMCGIPYHAADNYFKKLVDGGYKIAVAEETTERVISAKTVVQNGQKIDIETGEIISDEDNEELPTVSKITEGLDVGGDDDEDAELAAEMETLKAFDKEAMCILYDLFDGEINLV